MYESDRRKYLSERMLKTPQGSKQKNTENLLSVICQVLQFKQENHIGLIVSYPLIRQDVSLLAWLFCVIAVDYSNRQFAIESTVAIRCLGTSDFKQQDDRRSVSNK